MSRRGLSEDGGEDVGEAGADDSVGPFHADELREPPRRGRLRSRSGRLRRGAYLLPSLFTTGNMLLGFYAMVLGFHGRFDRAALMVFIAAFADTIDGRIARLTGTVSEFGAEYDSLADSFTFGAVPAVLAYLWGLNNFGRAGWLIPFFFMICAAVRLARFNVQINIVDSRYFVGLPAPSAAGAVCSLFFFVPVVRPGEEWLRFVVAAALLGIGVLMVSTFRYWSPKQINLRQRRSYRALLIIAAVLLVLAWEPRPVLLAVAAVYTLSGPALWVWGRLRSGRGRPDGPAPGNELPVEHS